MSPILAEVGVRATDRGAPPRVAGPPRRVLLIIDQLRTLGGAERMLLEMASRFPQSRFRPSILTFDLDEAVPAFRDCAVPIRVIPVGKTVSLRGLRAAVSLRRFVHEEKFDIIHTFFETADLWAAPICRASGCRVLISSRRDMGVLRGKKHRIAYPIVDKLFQQTLAVSNTVRDFTVQSGGADPRRVQTLYNGIDIAAIDVQRRLNAPAAWRRARSARRVVTVANIRHVKGIDVLLRAVALCMERIPEIQLLVAGKALETETMRELSELCRSLKLENKVFFVGCLENPYEFLDSAELFVLPSRNEGFSNALLEAMACQLPVIATNVGGNAEAVADGECGFIVPPENPEAMAHRMQMLLENAELARQMARRARQRVMAEFSMDAMMGKLMSVYDSCIAEAS